MTEEKNSEPESSKKAGLYKLIWKGIKLFVYLIVLFVFLTFCGVALALVINYEKHTSVLSGFIIPWYYAGVGVLIIVSLYKPLRRWCFRIIAILVCVNIILTSAMLFGFLNRWHLKNTTVVGETTIEYAEDHNSCPLKD